MTTLYMLGGLRLLSFLQFASLTCFAVLCLAAPLAAQRADVDVAEGSETEKEGAPTATNPQEQDRAEDEPLRIPANAPAIDGPDVLVLVNGTRLSGETVGLQGGRLAFKDQRLGVVKPKLRDVFSIFIAKRRKMYFQPNRDSQPREGFFMPGLYESSKDLIAFGEEVFPRLDESSDDTSDTEEDSEVTDSRQERDRNEGEFVPALQRYSLEEIHEIRAGSWRIDYKWKFAGTFSFSLQTTDGNSNRLQYGNDIRLSAIHPKHQFRLRQSGTYAEDQDIRSVQRSRGEFEYRYILTDKSAPFVRETLEHDDFRRIRLRSVTVAGGTIYAFRDTEFSWRFDIGLSFTAEDVKRGNDNDEYGGGDIKTQLEWKPDEDVKIVITDRYNQSFERGDTFDNTFEATISFNVWRKLTTSVSYWWRYRAQPPGSTEKQDTRLTMKFGWSFSYP